MPATTETQLSAKHLMAFRRGSALWASYDRALHDTARVELPPDVDREACRTILELVAAIERRDATEPEDAQLAVRTILGAYPKVHLHDPEVMSTMMGLELTERPSSIVLMAADRRRGIPSRFTFPPSIAQMTGVVDEISQKVLMMGRGARRGLGLASSFAPAAERTVAVPLDREP